MRLPNFHIEESTQEYVYVVDDYTDGDPTMTITNNPEGVLRKLWNEDILFSNTQRVFYKDTDNQIDELLHENGKFKGFKAGHDGVNL